VSKGMDFWDAELKNYSRKKRSNDDMVEDMWK
jgi:hypothetical protein